MIRKEVRPIFGTPVKQKDGETQPYIKGTNVKYTFLGMLIYKKTIDNIPKVFEGEMIFRF